MPDFSVSVQDTLDRDRAVRALAPAQHALTDGQQDALGSVLGALTSLL
ncbi:hypothetical protein [Nonomuraea gerenzanensis]|uniref:Uncharacterized protein n=1 Tax=Nonomuraea gerenzanensis TaxID=93944 RepID=A0A1M4EDM9_9ACTN|nr:hypothetical protein [Nonomuraea gerenzanensis]UBU08629.1 hypothetical protein LCN96_30045 [Nonomuraea gerenzanensis]SBO96989.1 hypothetical protein BN4615_P6505 [Nonomuraea gerenzanensis]